MNDQERDVETVRRGITPLGVYSVGGIAVETLANEALDRLVARIQGLEQVARAAEKAYDDVETLVDRIAAEARATIDRLEARIKTLEQERDEAWRRYNSAVAKQERAFARIHQLEAALREARPVLEYVSRGRGFVDVERYPDATARRALGNALSSTETKET